MSKQKKRKREAWIEKTRAEKENFCWWPGHVQTILTVIGRAMAESRLSPSILNSVPKEFGAILPSHKVTVRHVRGKELGRRKGNYRIEVEGPRLAGRWVFVSGALERLSRSAVEANRDDRRIQ